MLLNSNESLSPLFRAVTESTQAQDGTWCLKVAFMERKRHLKGTLYLPRLGYTQWPVALGTSQFSSDTADIKIPFGHEQTLFYDLL